MSSCPFCNFKEDRKLRDGELTFTILSNPRIAPGHLLVIPKRHVEKLSKLNTEETTEIFAFLADLQEKILNKLGTGTEIRQNYKPYLEDSKTHVNHFHFHIVPRNEGDEIQEKVDVYRKPLYRELPKEELEKISKLLS